MQVEFLGTSTSPLPSRNYSSLLVRIDRYVLMLDCGEGTQRQLFTHSPNTKLNHIRTVLITHLHPDHVLGLVPMMFSMMGPSAPPLPKDQPRLEIYGPLGLRALVRSTLNTCYASLSCSYVVHELLWPSHPEYPHTLTDAQSPLFSFAEADDATIPPAMRGQKRTLPVLPAHENELPGRNIRIDPTTYSWPDFMHVGNTRVAVSAAPIMHRCPTLGYVFTEPRSASASVSPRDLAILDSNAEALWHGYGIHKPRSLLQKLLQQREPLHLPDGSVLQPPPEDRPGRKLCVLGDTSDASGGLFVGLSNGADPVPDRGMLALARDADLLVHECTYASLFDEILQKVQETTPELARYFVLSLLPPEDATSRAISRGHSVPHIVGEFAALIEAKRVALNHFSARTPAPYVDSKDPLQDTAQLRKDERFDESVGRLRVMQEIERQVTQCWHDNVRARSSTKGETTVELPRAIGAYDGLVLTVEPRPVDSN